MAEVTNQFSLNPDDFGDRMRAGDLMPIDYSGEAVAWDQLRSADAERTGVELLEREIDKASNIGNDLRTRREQGLAGISAEEATHLIFDNIGEPEASLSPYGEVFVIRPGLRGVIDVFRARWHRKSELAASDQSLSSTSVTSDVPFKNLAQVIRERRLVQPIGDLPSEEEPDELTDEQVIEIRPRPLRVVDIPAEMPAQEPEIITNPTDIRMVSDQTEGDLTESEDLPDEQQDTEPEDSSVDTSAAPRASKGRKSLFDRSSLRDEPTEAQRKPTAPPVVSTVEADQTDEKFVYVPKVGPSTSGELTARRKPPVEDATDEEVVDDVATEEAAPELAPIPLPLSLSPHWSDKLQDVEPDKLTDVGVVESHEDRSAAFLAELTQITADTAEEPGAEVPAMPHWAEFVRDLGMPDELAGQIIHGVDDDESTEAEEVPATARKGVFDFEEEAAEDYPEPMIEDEAVLDITDRKPVVVEMPETPVAGSDIWEGISRIRVNGTRFDDLMKQFADQADKDQSNES